MEKIAEINLFNSPLEIGLRLLFVFKNSAKQSLDIQRLIYYNYLLIHSSDVNNALESLHPNFPNRSCEILISRDIILNGLNLLMSKNLICIDYRKTGVKYKKNDKTLNFLNYFDSTYSKELDTRAKWVCENFDGFEDNKLGIFMQQQLGKWGSEFSREYNVMGDDNS